MATPTVVAHHVIEWWEGGAGAILGALLGALIGSIIPLAWAWNARRIERKGEITAMQVEMYHARLAMNALRKDQIQAPLYHLPLTMFERGLPKLIGEDKLTPRQRNQRPGGVRHAGH
jgi:hypothetical protein